MLEALRGDKQKKEAFKAGKKIWIRMVLQGNFDMEKAATLLGTSASITSQKSLQDVEYWDFKTLAYFEDTDHPERKEERKQVHPSRWTEREKMAKC